MLLILLKSSACLAILMAFYKFCLENLSIHKFKRFYLLGAILVSAIIPFITFIEYVEPQFNIPYFEINHSVPLELLPTDEITTEEPINYLPLILWSIYGLGVILFGIKFFINLTNIISKIYKNEKQKQGHFITVLLQDLISPHTFFSYIFLNKTKFESQAIPKEVLLHEASHAKQKHSLDVLFIELMQVIFWFNPLLYFIKKDIKLNHEFLADKAVLNQGIDSSSYQSILLAFSSNATEPELANAINYSLIKKRFTIMKTKTSKKAIWLRSLLLLPLLGGLLFSFSSREEVEKEATISPEMIFSGEVENNNSSELGDVKKELQKTNILSEGVTEPMMNEYKSFMVEYKTKNRINNTVYKRIVAIYDLMSTKQKASVEKYPKSFLPKLSKIKNKKPTLKDWKSWKNEKEYALWLDGKNIKNNKLNNYNINDIVYFSGSFVHNNARSKKFPQPYQFRLFTKKGFEETYLKSDINKYNKLLENYELEIKYYKNKVRIDDSELRILKSQIDKLYTSFTKEEILKYNIQRAAEFSINKEKNDLKSYKKQDPILIINGIKCQECVLNLSKKGVEKLILETSNQESIIGFKIKFPGKKSENIKGNILNNKAIKNLNEANIGQVIQLFDIKTDSKKKLKPVIITLVEKNHKNYSHSPVIKKGEKSQLPPPPPPPPAKAPQYKKGRKLTLNEIIKKTPKNVESGYEMLENGESHYYTINKGKKTYYNKDGYITNKKGDILPPPPPPPPAPAPINGATKNKTGFININGKQHFYSKIKGKVKYYDRYGYEVDKKGNKLSNIQTDGSNVVPGQKLTKVYKNGKVVSEFKKTWKDNHSMDIPEPPIPPKPISIVEHIKNMTNKGSSFFYNGEKITSKRALNLVKTDKKINMSSHTDNGKSRVYLSTKPITVINGRTNIEKNKAKAKKLAMIERKKAVKENKAKIIEAREKDMKERKLAMVERKNMMRESRHSRKPLAEQFLGMEANGTIFFYEGKKISEAEAIALVTKNSKLNVYIHNSNGKGTVHLSKKGIKTINGSITN
ncbi:M56 family metallopeptidase [uncultured Lacinutrix sp.]|uniref:M56 family metallopeptidase n=1 Tax=uncultured Lacinutrix sp. TaxID=574032 RepID=UPI0026160E0C|nr:M56 family metallopeptidase [uncultured Lacinutrix sp.]